MDIERLTLDSPEPLLRSWHALRVAVHAERQPDVEPPGYAEAVTALASTEQAAVDTWCAVSDGAVVGFCTRYLPRERNDHMVRLEVAVAADHRRHGIGTTMAAEALAEVPAGRVAVVANGVAGSCADAFAASLGMPAVIGAPRSSLDLTALDLDRVHRLTEGDAAYAPVAWLSPAPGAIVGAFAAARQAMADAPAAGSEEVHWTVDDVRREERTIAAQGHRQHVVCLVRSAEVAALTEVTVHAGRPAVVGQGDTCVVPAHRGRRLGVRVKALMLLRLLDLEPQARAVHTWNAESNRHMLDVNAELGFVRRETWAQYEASLDVVRRRLGEPRQ